MDDQSLLISKKKNVIMRNFITPFITIIGFACVAFNTNINTDSYTGFAYKEGANTLIYTEQFTDKFVDGEQVESITHYFDTNHKHIATRKIDFSKSKFAPDFKTEDLRTGYIEGAEVADNNVKLFTKKDKNSPLVEKIIQVPEPVVVDGGFNQFIKTHWQELESEKSLSFNFTVSSSLDYYKLRAAKVAMNENELTIKVEPYKALLRWLANPIIIKYDRETHRILSYEGKSNIADDNGNNFTAKLVYPDKGP